METSWFESMEVAPQTWLISEPGVVNSYLLLGRERALLFDTGSGIGDIRAEVSRLTRLPVLVVNSHAHFDHIGGNFAYEEIAIAGPGAGVLEEGVPAALLEGFLTQTERTRALQAVYVMLDEVYFHELAHCHYCRPYPSGFSKRSLAIKPSKATQTLADGDTIDLGGRRLDVLHTPGHSADSICLWDETTGLLLTGDTLHNGHLYAHVASFDLQAYLRTMARLCTYIRQREISHVLPGHFRSPLEARRCDAVMAALTALAEGQGQPAGGVSRLDILNNPARQVFLAGISVFLPPTN